MTKLEFVPEPLLEPVPRGQWLRLGECCPACGTSLPTGAACQTIEIGRGDGSALLPGVYRFKQWHGLAELIVCRSSDPMVFASGQPLWAQARVCTNKACGQDVQAFIDARLASVDGRRTA